MVFNVYMFSINSSKWFLTVSEKDAETIKTAASVSAVLIIQPPISQLYYTPPTSDTGLGWVHTNAIMSELHTSLNKHTKPRLHCSLSSFASAWASLMPAAGAGNVVGWVSFFPLLSEDRKREALGGALFPRLPFRRLLRPGCCGTLLPVLSMAVDWLGYGYAALVASGGLIGYAKAGSIPSLAAGLFFGSLAGLGAYQLSQNPNNVWISLIC
ncbi:uncharacterized protein LOC104558810 isoform X2 [Colius striatus]|uniref:uncharacterized protein LOC104558810 isoform X2 n=1 Tax=Colius striatus TaxID=57412 RepID=UPI002B1DE444|nr:uncharacterized protein LOC104558810 isoform X2 [Colius striatus]